MEKESKHIGKIYLGLIIAVVSLIVIPFTIIYPMAYNPLQLVFSAALVVGIFILTKGLVENKYQKAYWSPFLLAGVLTIISMFTPESYNRLVEDDPDYTKISWLRDLKFLGDFQITELFLLILIIVASGVIIFISTKSFHQFDSIMKNIRVLRTMANFLIISPIFLFVEKNFHMRTDFAFFVVTPGFALVGPFFMGLMIKAALRIFRKSYSASLDEYQRKRNKIAYSFTIVAGYILLILRLLIDLIGGALQSILPSKFANFILAYNEIVVLIIACLAFISVFIALFYPRENIILLMITGIAIGITALLISWLFLIPMLLITIDLRKTRKMVKLKKIEKKLVVSDQISSILT